MKKASIKILSSALALCMVIAAGVLSAAAESTASTYDAPACERGEDLYLNVLTSEDGRFLCVGVEETDFGTVVTQKGCQGVHSAKSTLRSYPEKEVSKAFTYYIYDADHSLLAAFSVCVTGVYSQIDREALITRIAGDFSGGSGSSFTYTPFMNGNTASVNIYFKGTPVGAFQYKLSTNGLLTNG